MVKMQIESAVAAGVAVKSAPVKMFRRIGATNYEVTIHFSEKSKETLNDKMKRLIQNEIAYGGIAITKDNANSKLTNTDRGEIL